MNENQLSVINNTSQQVEALNNRNPIRKEVIRIAVLNPDLSQFNINLSQDIFVSAGDITHDALKGLMTDAVNELAQTYVERGTFRAGAVTYEWDADQTMPDASTLINPLVVTHIIDNLAGMTDIKADFRLLTFPLTTKRGETMEFFIRMAWDHSTAPQTLSKYHRYY